MSDGDETPNTAHNPPTAQTPQPPQAATGAPPAGTSQPPPPTAQTADGTGQDGGSETAEGAPQADAPQAVPDVSPGPKMVRRVVVSYRLGWLPGDWLQTWRRLDRVFASADLQVKATLAPLEDLPADTDILVVPPELREAAREAALPNTPILVTPASAAAGRVCRPGQPPRCGQRIHRRTPRSG